MAITEQQIDEVADTVRDLQTELSKINTLIVALQAQPFDKVDWTSAQKTQILNEYNTIKTELVSIFQQLP